MGPLAEMVCHKKRLPENVEGIERPRGDCGCQSRWWAPHADANGLQALGYNPTSTLSAVPLVFPDPSTGKMASIVTQHTQGTAYSFPASFKPHAQ